MKTVAGLLLVLGVLVVFWNVQYYGFLHYDDQAYVTKNPHVLSGLGWDGVRWAFATIDAGFWHPLTWLSFMADYDLYGMHAGGYHWTNVLLHALSTVLLFLVLERMTGAVWRSFAVSLLFGIHPLHVEPVAWIATRKDVLSGFFWMATLWFYVLYAERRRWWRYLPVLASYVFGLMSKPAVVTLPFVLFLLDYWPLGRFPGYGVRQDDRSYWVQGLRLFLEKAPLLLVALPFSVLAVIAEKHAGALPSFDIFPFGLRVGNAFISYARYLGKTVWPVDLAAFYPYPYAWPLWQVVTACALLAVISFLVFRWGKRYPYLTVGWLWFLGTLFPTIGLIQVGFHAMADRYTYLPLTGLFIMIVWGGSAVAAQWRRGTAPVSLIALILIFILMIDARAQVRHWQNSITLFSHAIKVTEQNYLAHNNLGCALMDRRDYAGAAHHYAATVRIRPNDAGPENNLGNALLMQGRMEEALFHYREAIRKEPNGVDAERNLGNALMKMKKPGPAVFHYRRALTLEPDNAELHNNLGVALFNVGDHEGAILHTREALRLRRDYADARRNMEIMLGAAGKR